MTSNAEVWAIVRFDFDNSKIEVFWSEANLRNAEIIDSQGRRTYGSHAEPLFIRNYPAMVTDYGEPRVIEIFLSRSPCADGSAVMNEANVAYPQGCGPKLITFAINHNSITLHVISDVVYAGNPDKPDETVRQRSLLELIAMKEIPNLHTHLSHQYVVVNP